MKTGTIILLALILLVCGWAAERSYAEFDPNSLNGAKIIYRAPCWEYFCFVLIKDGKESLVVLNEKQEVVFIYRIIRSDKEPVLELLYGKEMI